jgi:hypothetical protein
MAASALLLTLIWSTAVPWASAQPLEAGSAQPMGGPAPLDLQLAELRNAAISLPIATALGALLAFRPRRRGSPPRTSAVVHTQIILAIVGAVVMLVVGASLARAFGIVGAASLIRYRAKIDNPMDAGVMLSTLGIGLAAGVGMYMLAAFSAVFIMGVLWVVESQAPQEYKVFQLKITGKDVPSRRPAVEAVLRRARLQAEVRSSAGEELVYQVLVPFGRRLDRLTNLIQRLDESGNTAVEWEEKKTKT